MAVTLSVSTTNSGVKVATWVGDGAAGNGPAADFASTPIKTVQRVSGAGTYTVEGSNDGTTFGALNTPISAEATNDCIPIPENPRFLRVVTAAAAATVIITGV